MTIGYYTAGVGHLAAFAPNLCKIVGPFFYMNMYYLGIHVERFQNFLFAVPEQEKNTNNNSRL